MQEVLTIVILAGAVGYALWHIYKSFRRDADPCSGCEGCQLKELKNCPKHKNTNCCHKK